MLRGCRFETLMQVNVVNLTLCQLFSNNVFFRFMLPGLEEKNNLSVSSGIFQVQRFPAIIISITLISSYKYSNYSEDQLNQ